MSRAASDRLAALALVMAITFGGAVLLSALVVTKGLVSDDAVTLWANAIAASDSEMPIGRMVAAYPTIPFLATATFGLLAPAGTDAATLLAVIALAILGGLWFVSFHRVGLSLPIAAATALLLALHPALLRAAIAGPADMFLAVFLCLLGGALFDLRARSSAPEVMGVALALLGLAFSHPMGAAIACGAVPLLIFAIRPEMLAGPARNILMTLVFPTLFCVAAFAYMSWIFPGSGWSFLVAPAQGLARWSVGFADLYGGGLTGSLLADALAASIIAFLLAAPLVPVAATWIAERRALIVPTVLTGAVVALAIALAVTTGMFGPPVIAAVASPILAAVMISRVPVLRERMKVVLPLLVLGWFGGIGALLITDPGSAKDFSAALEGRDAVSPRLAALKLGEATAGREGVLVDTFNAPAIVLGRGSARGLLSPAHEEFTLGILFSRIDAPFVAVPDPQTGAGAQDRLNRAFPTLFRRGAAGYRLIYENPEWRLFART